jgi:hypothetical protein
VKIRRLEVTSKEKLVPDVTVAADFANQEESELAYQLIWSMEGKDSKQRVAAGYANRSIAFDGGPVIMLELRQHRGGRNYLWYAALPLGYTVDILAVPLLLPAVLVIVLMD